MQRWQQRQKQKAHYTMVQQARPTIKRYSKSREKPNLSGSNSQSKNNKINEPFRQVLNIFQLQKYEQLLLDYGFPERIKEKESMTYIDDLLKKVNEEDQDKLYTLMNALLSISVDLKGTAKKSLLPKKIRNKNYPPAYNTHNSTNLKKCDSFVNKRADKTPKFRIKCKSNMQHTSIHLTPQSNATQKTVLKRSKAHDDSNIIHQFRLKGKPSVNLIYKTNNLINRIEERLKKLKGYEKNEQTKDNDAKLYYKQIKQMYLSYDTATLTSNIANIDIEEIIDCYAIEIEKKLKQQPLNPEKLKIRSKSKNYHIQKLLKESLIQKQKEQLNKTYNSQLDDQIQQTVSVGSEDSKGDFSESQEFFDFQVQSLTNDFNCFNYQYDDSISKAYSRKDIKNFIQLVMMAGKMEKQTPIISYAYILRLMNVCKKDQINWKNWKNLLLITLIEASKIWDDQSLQNHSFSKVIKPYTTLQINRLERHLLTFLNYRLKVQPKQYCESYFKLRKHASAASKTVHLMHLNLQTIKKLQSGTKKCEKNLKQTYKNKLNESF